MTLAYDVSGTGPAVVLLHSGVCDRRMWEPQVPALAGAGYRVVRCDFRGYGETPVADRPYSDSADVAELLEHLGVERAAFVASSYGGEVALELAAARPDSVTALALLCSAMPGHTPSAELRAFAEREGALFTADDLEGAVELNVRTWVGPEATEEARDQVRRMQRQAFELQWTAEHSSTPHAGPDLARITAPTLTVSGAHDLPDFHQIATALASQLPAAHHMELPWAGHLPSLERPAETTALLIRFLQQASTGA